MTEKRPPWMQIEIRGSGEGFLTRVTGSAGDRNTTAQRLVFRDEADLRCFREPETEPLAAAEFAVRWSDLERFRDELKDSVEAREAPSAAHSGMARALYRAIFQGDLLGLFGQIRGEGGGEVLIKLAASTPALRSIPWEAIQGPADGEPALAVSDQIRITRDVISDYSASARDVPGAVRVLVVAAGDMLYAVEDLQDKLEPAIERGDVQLEPRTGDDARWESLLSRLQREPKPHVLHLACHGRMTDSGPRLLLDPDEGEQTPAENLATAIRDAVPGLQLVYLESCEGAAPGALASAAERMVAAGVEASIAHLWETDAEDAKDLAAGLYAALAQAGADGRPSGDVAQALNHARLGLSGRGQSAYLSLVLYLRGCDSGLFDFSGWRASAARQEIGSALEATLRGPGTLLIGDALEMFRDIDRYQALCREIHEGIAPGSRSPYLHEMLQHYEILYERDDLKAIVDTEFEKTDLHQRYWLLDQLASLKSSGLFVTLLWFPLVELALARQHPNREILVYQMLSPSEFSFTPFTELSGVRLFRRHASQWDWIQRRRLQNDEALRKALHPDPYRQCIVLRLYGGYSVRDRGLEENPTLTDDDQMRLFRSLEKLPDEVLGFLRGEPISILGIDPRAWQHREFMRRLVGKQLLEGESRVFLSPDASEIERRYWIDDQNVSSHRFEELVSLLAERR